MANVWGMTSTNTSKKMFFQGLEGSLTNINKSQYLQILNSRISDEKCIEFWKNVDVAF